jgi:hypothetical protein
MDFGASLVPKRQSDHVALWSQDILPAALAALASGVASGSRDLALAQAR